MAKIQNLQAVVSALRSKAAKSIKDDNVSVVVGFTAAYAVYVHENLEAHHPVGQAKFLEEPAIRIQGELGDQIKDGITAGRTLAQVLLLAGLRLQREAQKLCPVDTGALRASAFTRLEQGRKWFGGIFS